MVEGHKYGAKSAWKSSAGSLMAKMKQSLFGLLKQAAKLFRHSPVP